MDDLYKIANLATSLVAAVPVVVALVATAIQKSKKIGFDPWNALLHWIGSRMNADVKSELDSVKSAVNDTNRRLDEHIRSDDIRHADMLRREILKFSNQIVRGIPHTREDYNNILAIITEYKHYCATHVEYQNDLAVHAIRNIENNYDRHIEQREFKE